MPAFLGTLADIGRDSKNGVLAIDREPYDSCGSRLETSPIEIGDANL
jgi:hypothetical protein